jgi:para-aminobenzoate synthetase component 1
MKLPNLRSLAEAENHIALLYDARDGHGILGLGVNRSLLLGGDLRETEVFSALEKFTEEANWTFGWMGYDLKNSFLPVDAAFVNPLGLPDLAWWEPQVVIKWQTENADSTAEVIQGDPSCELAMKGLEALKTQSSEEEVKAGEELFWSWKKEEYLGQYNKVQNLIQAGDVYELNLCQTLWGSAPASESWPIFTQLALRTKAPFSAYMQCGSARVMSGSPERFLKREGDTLISQPIKGTISRGATPAEDAQLKERLASSEKDRAENVMITDLVRNDLSRVAVRDSVEVSDLCGIHTFETVHQMISEIKCKVESETGLAEILKATFPMGSMTGAPKISAMNNIDALEKMARGVYSGSVGYVDPQGNFDLNVLIRSLFHNATSEKIQASVGGAITTLSDGEEELNECHLKAQALISSVTQGSAKQSDSELHQ